MITRDEAFRAGQELADIAVLAIDKTPNKQQIVQFATEGFSAIEAVAKIGIPAERKAAVATNLAEGFLNRLNTGVEQFQLPTE